MIKEAGVGPFLKSRCPKLECRKARNLGMEAKNSIEVIFYPFLMPAFTTLKKNRKRKKFSSPNFCFKVFLSIVQIRQLMLMLDERKKWRE